MKKIINSDLINILIKYLSIIMFSMIFILLIGIDTRMNYSYMNSSKLDNYMCLAVILIVALIIIIVQHIIKKKYNLGAIIEKKEKLIIGIIFILLFVFQIIVFHNIYFQTGWDVSQMFYTAESYAENGVFDNNLYYRIYPYFDVYPNNIFLASIFGIIIKLAMFFNCSQTNKVLVVISIILVDLAGIIMVKTIENFSQRKIYKIFGAALYAVFIGMSPWYLIPYSDTFSIVFPISLLYNYTKKEKKMHNYLLIGLFSYLGYLIKPTSIIILIAIVIIEVYKTLFRDKAKIKKVLKNGAALIIGVLIVVLLNTGLQNIIKYEGSNKYSFSLYHYLMMGINQETTGSYSQEDVLNSLATNSYEERIEYNKEIFFERIKSMSFKDFCEFYAKKTLLNYNDGTFAWGLEGNFYARKNNIQTTLAKALKDFFYNKGDMFYTFSSIMQTIWIFVLATTILGAILKKFDYKNSVTYLALIGLTMFVLIFEARARYMYLYSTYYIILAITGIEAICERKRNKVIMQKYN